MTSFLRGALLLTKILDPPLKLLVAIIAYREHKALLKLSFLYNIYSYSWIYPIYTTEWHNFSGQDEAIGNKTSCWAGLDISLPRREK